MYYLGIDLGSSSIKFALVEAQTGKRIGLIQHPEQEMPIQAPHKGWAEQSPELWWKLCCEGIQRLLEISEISPDQIKGIGIGYQMHGLVLVDAQDTPLRDAIIWCDSRAISVGEGLSEQLGEAYSAQNLLNSIGNFTAAKLAWVAQNEPGIYAESAAFLLPGDYLALKLTDQLGTTATALSEGIFWDFDTDKTAHRVVDLIAGAQDLVPPLQPILGDQGCVSEKAAQECGLSQGTPLLYRAGDQPNNALSLQVMEPGQVAATGGTSGVLYAVTDVTDFSEIEKVNHFIHVNHLPGSQKRIGTLLCINACGILYRWMKQQMGISSYSEMNELAQSTALGADDLCILPFGNGAERMLGNRDIGAHIIGLDLNRHDRAHLCRATLEGIAFAFYYGFELLMSDGIHPESIRTGNDNLFQSELFSTTLATLAGVEIEMYNTTGAEGAARACALAEGRQEAFKGFMKNDYLKSIHPEDNRSEYLALYKKWRKELNERLKSNP